MRRLGLVGQPWDILEENHVTSGVALSFASTSLRVHQLGGRQLRHGVVVVLSGGRMDELPLQQRAKKAAHQGAGVGKKKETAVSKSLSVHGIFFDLSQDSWLV